jgi:hypothetical protein
VTVTRLHMSDALITETHLDSNHQVKSPNATEPNGHDFPYSNGIVGGDPSADSPATPASVVTQIKTPSGETLFVEAEMKKLDSFSAAQSDGSTDQGISSFALTVFLRLISP